MNPISAPLQKTAPQPDREVGSSQPESEVPTRSQGDARRGFADALRAASGRPAGSRDGTDKGATAGVDGGTPTTDPAQAIPELPAAPAASADTASAAAAMLANILNAVSTPAPASVSAANTDDRAGAAAPVTDGSALAGGAPALRLFASSPGSTAGAGSVPQDDTVLGLTNAAGTAALREDRSDPVGPTPATPPKVTVLDRATHFKPVLPNPAPGGPARFAPLAPEAAPVPADGTGAKLQRAPAEFPALIAAASPKIPGQVPLQAPSQGQPQPVSDSAEAAVRAAGTRLEKADVTAPSDIRAVSGIARTGLASDKRSEADVSALSDIRAVAGIARAGLASDKRSEEAEVAGPEAPGAAGIGLPVGTLPTIAAAIRDEIDRAAAAEPASRAPQADQAVRTAPDGPLRVLRIQLRPDDLGTVTVELRLANGQLETHLRASQPETAALLHRDAAILTDLLKQANYQAEVTVGQARPSDSGGFSGNAPSQGQAGFSDGGARPGQGGDRQRQADRNPAAGRREGERGDEAIRPRDGSVYL